MYEGYRAINIKTNVSDYSDIFDIYVNSITSTCTLDIKKKKQ